MRRSFDGDGGAAWNGLLVKFRDDEFQDAVFIFGADIGGFDVADVEAALAGTAVAFLANEFAVVVFFVGFGVARCADGEGAVFQVDFDVFLLKAWQIHIEFICAVELANVGLHHLRDGVAHWAHHKIVIKEIVK